MSYFNEDFTPTPADLALRDALHAYRKQVTEEKFGRVLRDSGPGLIMSNKMLHRIIDCVHYHKIQSVDQLIKETNWSRANELGSAVIQLIQLHNPPAAVLTSQPLPLHTDIANQSDPASVSAASPSVKVPIELHTCGACGMIGHTSRSKDCTLEQSSTTGTELENTELAAEILRIRYLHI